MPPLAAPASAVLVNNLVDHAVFFGLFGIHDEIPLDVFLDAIDGLTTVLRKKLIDDRAHAQNLFRMEVNVGSLAAKTGHPRLVNQNARVGKREAFLWRAAGKKNGSDGRGLSDTGAVMEPPGELI